MGLYALGKAAAAHMQPPKPIIQGMHPEKLLVAELVQGCVGSRGNAYSLGFVSTQQWSMHFTRFHVVKWISVPNLAVGAYARSRC